MAITVQITAVSERPRLLTIENPIHIPAAPPSSRSTSPVSPVSDIGISPTRILPPSRLDHSSTRYAPIRTNSSPATVHTLRSPQPPTHFSRPTLSRTPASSFPISSPYGNNSHTTSTRVLRPDLLSQHPTDYSYSATCFSDGESVRSSSSMTGRRVVDSRSSSQVSDYSRSRSDSSESGSKPSRKNKTGKRKRGSSAASTTERTEVMRCGRHGDEWLFDGWGHWFRRFWRE